LASENEVPFSTVLWSGNFLNDGKLVGGIDVEGDVEVTSI